MEIKDYKLMDIIKGFVVTEKAIRLIQENNTLTVYVDRNATKPLIKEAIEKIFNVKVVKVNTLNAPNNYKKAYVKLDKKYSAYDIVSKLGLL